MRRIILLGIAILLFAPACVNHMRYPFPDGPGITMRLPGRGARGPALPPPRPVPCREVSRLPCDMLHCGEPGRDFVTIQCAGSPAIAGKCEPNGGCGLKGRGEGEEGD